MTLYDDHVRLQAGGWEWYIQRIERTDGEFYFHLWRPGDPTNPYIIVLMEVPGWEHLYAADAAQRLEAYYGCT